MRRKVVVCWIALGMCWGRCNAAPSDDWGIRAIDDAQRVLTAPVHWEAASWQRAAELGLLTGALMWGADDAVEDYHLHHVSKSEVDAARTLDVVVSPGTLIGAGTAVWVWGRARGDGDIAVTGFQAAESALYATAVAGGFKVISGRARPSTGAGPGEFHGPGWRRDDYQSLPSAHAAAAFAAARAVAPSLETPVAQTLLYGSAGLMAYSRVYAGQHWLSDVVFGSALGYWVGATVAGNGAERPRATGWQVLPTPRGVVAGWEW